MSYFLTEYTLVVGLQILALIMPGPDYILVVSNASLQSRKHGIYTAFGIALGIGVQVIACLFGLALIIKESPVLFETVTWLCAAYLAYLGGRLLYFTVKPGTTTNTTVVTKTDYFRSIKQGLFCNLLNPKALLFFLSLFTLVIDEHTPISWQITYGITMMITTFSWFTLVSLLITHPACQKYVQKVQKFLQPLFGLLLLGYGIIIFIY
jgi:RhtB (resistance to homoserine/threonine) family protein